MDTLLMLLRSGRLLQVLQVTGIEPFIGLIPAGPLRERVVANPDEALAIAQDIAALATKYPEFVVAALQSRRP